MQKHGPVVGVDCGRYGFPKQGKHSVGVARQYCGQVGKQDNCQVAVSLSVSTWASSLPVAWRLYLPEVWARIQKRRTEAGVPEGVEFQTKPQIALEQIRASGPARHSSWRGGGGRGLRKRQYFRAELTRNSAWNMWWVLSLPLRSGNPDSTLAGPARKPGGGATPKRLQRDADHQPFR